MSKTLRASKVITLVVTCLGTLIVLLAAALLVAFLLWQKRTAPGRQPAPSPELKGLRISLEAENDEEMSLS